jgi:hypothetical protein
MPETVTRVDTANSSFCTPVMLVYSSKYMIPPVCVRACVRVCVRVRACAHVCMLQRASVRARVCIAAGLGWGVWCYCCDHCNCCCDLTHLPCTVTSNPERLALGLISTTGITAGVNNH